MMITIYHPAITGPDICYHSGFGRIIQRFFGQYNAYLESVIVYSLLASSGINITPVIARAFEKAVYHTRVESILEKRLSTMHSVCL